MKDKINIIEIKPVVSLEGKLQPDYEIELILPEGFEAETEISSDSTRLNFNEELTAPALEARIGQKNYIEDLVRTEAVGWSLDAKRAFGADRYQEAIALAILEAVLPEYFRKGEYSLNPQKSKITFVSKDCSDIGINAQTNIGYDDDLNPSVVSIKNLHFKGIAKLDSQRNKILQMKDADIILNMLYNRKSVKKSKNNLPFQKAYGESDTYLFVPGPKPEDIQRLKNFLGEVYKFLDNNQREIKKLYSQAEVWEILDQTTSNYNYQVFQKIGGLSGLTLKIGFMAEASKHDSNIEANRLYRKIEKKRKELNNKFPVL